ncbi:MAG: YfiR family protein [Alphaproteobacteria bacterium]|nr:YfiR family protein [Alphaproteobacteria bacterium]
MAPLPAVAADAKEYLVKAAFMYNFVKFVEWPGELAVSKRKSIDICATGDGAFVSSAANVFKEASTAALKLNMVEEKNWQDAASHCHMLYIGQGQEAHVAEILAALKQKPVLTVSDLDNFAQSGGIVGFVLSDNKIKLVVNTRAASEAGLRVDAQLLEIALKVIKN